MLIIALFQLLPLLVVYSTSASAAPFNPWQEGSSVEYVLYPPLSSPPLPADLELTWHRFDNFPVKRSNSPAFAAHSRRHALRFEQHEEQKRNYLRNILDERHTADHAELMGVARDLSSNQVVEAKDKAGSVTGLGKRAPSDAHSQPMADCESICFACASRRAAS
jgi:hypothetical protein